MKASGVMKFLSFAIAAFLAVATSGCQYILPKEETPLAPPLVQPKDIVYSTVDVVKGDMQQTVQGEGRVESVKSRRLWRPRVEECLGYIGLKGCAKHRPAELSGGEQQRVAIAIALSNRPKILLADEPTGAVDSRTADTILDIFREVNRQLGVTVVIVTHDLSLSRKVDRIVAIRDGRTSSEYVSRASYVDELRNVKNLNEMEQHVELAVVDATGRLQIPRDYLDSIGSHGRSRLRVEMEGDRVVLYNPGDQKHEEKAE